jgi:hypothetical protein
MASACQGAPHESRYVQCVGTVTNHSGDPYGAFHVCDTCGRYVAGHVSGDDRRCGAQTCAVCGQPGPDART